MLDGAETYRDSPKRSQYDQQKQCRNERKTTLFAMTSPLFHVVTDLGHVVHMNLVQQ